MQKCTLAVGADYENAFSMLVQRIKTCTLAVCANAHTCKSVLLLLVQRIQNMIWMFAQIVKTWKRALWLLVQMSRTLQNALWDVYETLHVC